MILNRTDYQEAKGRCSFANVCLPEGPIMALSLFLSLSLRLLTLCLVHQHYVG